MNKVEFDNVACELLMQCLDTLQIKGKEYSLDDDRLNFFKQDIIPETRSKNFLFNMALKQIKSISDMTKLPVNKSIEKHDLWKEKIIDTINYMVLLWGLVVEEKRENHE